MGGAPHPGEWWAGVRDLGVPRHSQTSHGLALPWLRFPPGLSCAPLHPQILTQEDWNVVLYNGMASTSPWASLYFVALMTFGNYVLFNLLVAILVEGFQAEVTALKGAQWGKLRFQPRLVGGESFKRGGVGELSEEVSSLT